MQLDNGKQKVKINKIRKQNIRAGANKSQFFPSETYESMSLTISVL